MAKETIHSPLFIQWSDLKKKHPNAFLLFRCGDFYESYNEDAIIASEILGITLTKPRSNVDITGMAGFPYHALDTYLPKLIRAGKRVAICEAIEDPNTKKLVKRGITEIINPNNNENNMETNSVNKQQIEGIAVETLKALNGVLPSSLNKRFADAIGTLQFINLKYTNNAKIFSDEMAYLLKYAEIGLKTEKIA